jgi:hypothetical protein
MPIKAIKDLQPKDRKISARVGNKLLGRARAKTQSAIFEKQVETSQRPSYVEHRFPRKAQNL